MSVPAGYKIDRTIDFQSDSRTKIVLVFEDADGMMARIRQVCKGVRLIFEAGLTFIKNPKVGDVTPPGGHLKYRLTSNEPFGGRVELTKSDRKYYFKHPGVHDKDNDDYSDFIANITISVSAKVVKVNRGKVSGNKITTTSLDFLTYGVEIAAEKEFTKSSSLSRLPGRKVHASSSAGGFLVWAWAAVGGMLVAIAGLTFTVSRRQVCWGVSRRRPISCPDGSYVDWGRRWRRRIVSVLSPPDVLGP